MRVRGHPLNGLRGLFLATAGERRHQPLDALRPAPLPHLPEPPDLPPRQPLGDVAVSASVAGPDEGGSSPLARGTRPAGVGVPHPGRFIPARAGNTARRQAAHRLDPVHPRSRGEHFLSLVLPPVVLGSSPLARGTLVHREHAREAGRFIPARAGNTARSNRRRPRRSVHPRSRGEHAGGGRVMNRVFGSSPLARGTPWRQAVYPPMHRFIPARAGNTIRAGSAPKPSTVHPRSRGEHDALRNLAEALDRFIPARAGNTSTSAQWF